MPLINNKYSTRVHEKTNDTIIDPLAEEKACISIDISMSLIEN